MRVCPVRAFMPVFRVIKGKSSVKLSRRVRFANVINCILLIIISLTDKLYNSVLSPNANILKTIPKKRKKEQPRRVGCSDYSVILKTGTIRRRLE
jgi:hypothetical protein